MNRIVNYYQVIIILVIFGLNVQTSYSQGCVNCDENSVGTGLDGASAIGSETKALNDYTFAAGFDCKSSGIGSIAMGKYLNSTDGYSITIGAGYSEYQRFVNDKAHYIMMGSLSTKPTFVIAPAPSSNKTGEIGIGNVIFPDAKLHLRSDEGENATVFIEPNNWAAGEKAMLALGGLNYGISSDSSSGFAFKSSANYRFINGKVGIGAFNFNPPEAKLHIKCIQGEDADIFLEPYTDEILGERGSWQANLYLGTREHGVVANKSLGLVFLSDHDYIFNDLNPL
jgi:hypothetical protein